MSQEEKITKYIIKLNDEIVGNVEIKEGGKLRLDKKLFTSHLPQKVKKLHGIIQ